MWDFAQKMRILIKFEDSGSNARECSSPSEKIRTYSQSLTICVIVDGFAVVTLSKPRYKRFDGLALADTLEEKDADPWCGVQIISLDTGSVVHWIRFDGAIQELFDVCVLPGVKDALTIAPHSAEFNSFITFESLPNPPEVPSDVPLESTSETPSAALSSDEKSAK